MDTPTVEHKDSSCPTPQDGANRVAAQKLIPDQLEESVPPPHLVPIPPTQSSVFQATDLVLICLGSEGTLFKPRFLVEKSPYLQRLLCQNVSASSSFWSSSSSSSSSSS
eukprot:CAMPEP_0175123278 /NCGR_PEP_ID=MMETSP0087-20121206/2158_1 /TAXON_ID=136419 /ORGANISM="Unknown Unknown, Strain D1" /LENGTH=108 /DNA_ID=CAMNT_0016404959 /DNA_START=40 /DNA_END=362 /DNA_ORIENTATION=-